MRTPAAPLWQEAERLHIIHSECSPAGFPVACKILQVGPQAHPLVVGSHHVLEHDLPHEAPTHDIVLLIRKLEA